MASACNEEFISRDTYPFKPSGYRKGMISFGNPDNLRRGKPFSKTFAITPCLVRLRHLKYSRGCGEIISQYSN